MPGDRTEQATPHHRQKATEKGDRAHSRDLMAAAAMLAGVFALGGAARAWLGNWVGTYRACLALGQPSFWERTRPEAAATALRGVLIEGLSPVGVVLAASLGAALVAGIVQGGGWALQFEALRPKMERLSPAENVKNVVSLRGAVRLGKSLVPVGALGFCAVHAIAAEAGMAPMSVERYPEVLARLYTLLLSGVWIFLGWAGVDYVMEWRSREGRLRMSKQELRDEYRETEGSPQVKTRIRGLRRQMRRRQMKADMARATVVITNPTHYAVALSFDFETMEPPRVVARGRDLLAAQIREEAQWAGVPIVENPPLARSLYRQVETGQAIPYELYAAAAAILAWLYRRQVEERLRREQVAAAGGRGRGRWHEEAAMSTGAVAPGMAGPGESGRGSKLRAMALPAAAISVIFVMLVPVPAWAMDLLLGASMAASVLVFLSAVQLRRAVEFSVFPTLLLLLTLFRLSLNIASSRRILLHGHEGTAAAGQVIEAFGQFVVGGNYVVGFVLFLALIAIQFLVVSHGAVRTAEVTARFTLDALPGKQMAIDADMNAGLIDEITARKRRQAIAQEAEFYGAMDGAARFNQRDALATILITAINIVAGLLIGTLQQGIALGDAVRTYTILTVGDGLVTMIPSLLVSVAGGIVLTRASSGGRLTTELGAQLLGRGTTLYVASAVLGALCLIPGLPKLAFLLPAVALGIMGSRAAKRETQAAESEPAKKAAVRAEAPALPPRLDDLSLEIGFQLIPLVDEKQGGQMLERVRTLRRHLAGELGFLIPPIHISDNLRLKAREYAVSLRGLEIGRWQTEGNCLLAVSADAKARPLPGRETREPAYGVAARWIQPTLEEEALAAGYSVVDQGTVIGTHVAELIRGHAWELLGRAETKRLLDSLGESHPKLVEELVPKMLSLGEVEKVLQQLLRERVSIRDLGAILEALVEAAAQNRGLPHLVEAARQALGRRLTQPLLEADGTLRVMTLEPGLEEELAALMSPEGGRLLAGGSGTPILRRIVDSVKSLIGPGSVAAPPVLLCVSPARYHLWRWLEPALPRLTILAPGEIAPGVPLRAIGTIRRG